MALKNLIDTERAAKRLADWLSARLPDAQDITVTDVKVPGAGGLSNETVLFTARWRQGGIEQTRGMVARVQPDGPGVFPDYALRKESTVIKALADTPVAVPGVYFFEDDSAVFGARSW